MRCGRCGNENGEANRFCGMCGAPLVAAGQARGPAATLPAGLTPPAGKIGAPAQAAAVPPVAARVSQAPLTTPPRPAELDRLVAERQPAPLSRPEDDHRTGPVITGHSFLGLNSPGPITGGGRDGFHDDRQADRHAESGRDPLRPSSNLDYLLDDDEEERSNRGGGKLILLVVAVALAAGFGYLHWKQGGFDWLNARDQKPPAIAKPTPDATQNGADSGSGTTATSDAGTPPAGGVSTSPPANGQGMNPAEPASAQSTAPQAGPQGTVEQSAPSQPASVQPQTADPNLPAGSRSQPAGSESVAPSTPADETAAPREPRKASPIKPAAAKPVDVVTEAERFIYGRGVKRDCDHGLRLLKPAAAQSNPKAMISLGALYSTGVCTPRDLPTAYRWLALALHKQPDNQALQDDLQKLWAQMTQPERQLAIKLSQ